MQSLFFTKNKLTNIFLHVRLRQNLKVAMKRRVHKEDCCRELSLGEREYMTPYGKWTLSRYVE